MNIVGSRPLGSFTQGLPRDTLTERNEECSCAAFDVLGGLSDREDHPATRRSAGEDRLGGSFARSSTFFCTSSFSIVHMLTTHRKHPRFWMLRSLWPIADHRSRRARLRPSSTRSSRTSATMSRRRRSSRSRPGRVPRSALRLPSLMRPRRSAPRRRRSRS